MADKKSDVVTKVDGFFSKYPKRSYPKGQILIFANESPEHIFYLKSGKVREYDISYRGDEVIVNVFKEGAFFPMSWAINGGSNSYFFKAEAATEVHIVPAADAVAFLQQNPDVMYDLLSRIYRGMEGLLGRLVRLMSGTARSRVIYELILESRRFGEEGPKDFVQLQINEGELAARTGLSRETVSREIQKLKDTDTVGVQGKLLHIKSITMLENMLGRNV